MIQRVKYIEANEKHKCNFKLLKSVKVKTFTFTLDYIAENKAMKKKQNWT